MSIKSAENVIYNCQMQIMQSEEQIRKLQKDIQKLEDLDKQYEELSKEFQRRNWESIQEINNLCNLRNSLRAVSSYVTHMHQMLSGEKYNAVADGLWQAKRVIVDRIFILEEEISNLKKRIDGCHTQIKRSYAEIRAIREKREA